jgi:hypothetical protein
VDYARIVNDLIADCDLTTDSGRRVAYRKCEAYADENLHERRAFNDFTEAVGQRLGLPPTLRNSFRDTVGEPAPGAKLHLRYAGAAGPELTGNADGLRYLAGLVAELADEAVEGDHVHLYPDEHPMYGRTYPLTIYHEPDPWFESLDKEGAGEEEQAPSVAERDIDPSDIAALCVLAKIPPAMLLTPQRLYRVLSVDAYRGQEIWERRIREGDERFFVFTLVNDAGSEEVYGFDLDDPNILPFSQQDVAGLQGPD